MTDGAPPPPASQGRAPASQGRAPASQGRAVTIALPKGRTLGPVSKLLERAGMTAEDGAPLAHALDESSRALIRRARLGEHPFHLLLLKPDDVPTYVEYGTADLGVCGRDVLIERDADMYYSLDLGIGRCRLVVAGRVGVRFPSDSRMPRIATKYPRTAARHFARSGIQVEIVNVQSSVELAPLTGLADEIVDLVETGATLAQNGLEVKDEILSVSTLLLTNRASQKLRREPVDRLVGSLRSVLQATG